MKKIVFLTALLSIVSITNAQDRQEAIRTQNVQKSWVKNIPFQALPLTRGAGEIIQIERNPKDPYQLYVALSQSHACRRTGRIGDLYGIAVAGGIV